ncbi:MAG TPA: choice-of-anchor tandem repeat GloVer-containing protein [Candidatus Cybelea sp.]|nr:choice-of-anchor tandem repeat GloVer-containing protein [Candidatus Cybelea sp.]
MLAGCSANIGTPPQTSSNGASVRSSRQSIVPLAATRWQEKNLISFSPYDPAVPEAPVIFDTSGAIYGTVAFGGTCTAHACGGGVFKLTPSSSGHWNETILYAFCSRAHCKDGANPQAGLTFDSQGSLYGTTTYGGSANEGSVFKLTPSKSGYRESVLYSFCQAANCADGANPTAPVIFDKNGALYGTTSGGGLTGCRYSECGTVFKLTPSASSYSESVLYRFCMQTGCSDGAAPVAGLVFGANGVLYGTTEYGGRSGCTYYDAGCGTVFQLAPSASGYSESVLYAFCKTTTSCTDGDNPAAGVIVDREGALYGTTLYGGPGGGAVYKLTPSSSTFRYSLLYGFCNRRNCNDGTEPFGGLVFGKRNALYGTTTYGGVQGAGTLFKLTSAGSIYRERVLHNFSASTTQSWPYATPVFGPDGALYGTSTGHTLQDSGAVWRVWRD